MTSHRAGGVAVDSVAIGRATGSTSTAAAPMRLHGYDIVAVIEDGGSSTVYLGRRTGLHGFRRDVAIKVLHPHLRRRPDAVKRFYREARLGARLRHPHVVPVLDLGPSTEAPFMVMEWIEGIDLARLTRIRRPSWPLVGRILHDALLGLHAVHELTADDGGPPLGLVHRDFSPANLLVGVDGLTRLTDLGISRPPTERITTTGIVQGTVPYLSPEQCRGEALDRRSDVWSAGAIAFELLGGSSLVGASLSPAAAVGRIASGDYPSIRQIAADLPSDLADAVDRALDPDPSARWATADAFRRAMVAGFEREEPLACWGEVAAMIKTALRSSHPPAAPLRIPNESLLGGPPPSSELADRPRRAQSRVFGAAVAAMVAVSGAAWGAAYWRVDASSAPSNTTRPDLPRDADAPVTAVEHPATAAATTPASDRPNRPPASSANATRGAVAPARAPSRGLGSGRDNTAATQPSAPPLAPNPYADPKQD